MEQFQYTGTDPVNEDGSFALKELVIEKRYTIWAIVRRRYKQMDGLGCKGTDKVKLKKLISNELIAVNLSPQKDYEVDILSAMRRVTKTLIYNMPLVLSIGLDTRLSGRVRLCVLSV